MSEGICGEIILVEVWGSFLSLMTIMLTMTLLINLPKQNRQNCSKINIYNLLNGWTGKATKNVCVMGFGFGIFKFSRPSHHNKQRKYYEPYRIVGKNVYWTTQKSNKYRFFTFSIYFMKYFSYINIYLCIHTYIDIDIYIYT